MKHLIIIGVGGFAREVYWHAKYSRGYGTDWEIKGFLDGDVKLDNIEYSKLSAPLLGDIKSYIIEDDDVFICAIASPTVRKKVVKLVLDRGGRFINLIQKNVIIHDTAQIGIGNIIIEFSVIHDNATIGNYVVLNGGVAIGHDASIGDYSSLMGRVNILGSAKVGRETFWGANAIALPHSRIEDGVYVGVASVVFKCVRKGLKVFGNPAMPM